MYFYIVKLYSEMDFQTAIIGLLTFVVCAGILLFIAKFGIKEKSYEDALAEQRKHTSTLLGPQKTSKPKEKKIKKSTKKVKEKPTVTLESESPEESEDTDSHSSALHAHQKLHVEFKEPTIIEESASEEVVPNPISKKEEQPKPDVCKEKSSVSKQNGVEQEAKEKNSKPQKITSEDKENKNKQQPKEKINKDNQNAVVEEVVKPKKQLKLEVVQAAYPEEDIVSPVTTVPLQTNGHAPNVLKEKKKKKNDTVNLQYLTGSKDVDVSLNLLLNAVRKAELSRSEVQILIDLLLNKQHEAPTTLDDWSEGKADPVQKLKKQLAEKEKALTEEQEALAGAQAKLREIRLEQTAEKSQLVQRNRTLEEALQAKHLELQAVNSRAVSQNQKIQQLQAQLNEEALLLHNLREENTGLQLQRQQVDLHLSQAQEAEATIQELQSRNNQLTLELHTLTEQNMAAKEHHQNAIVLLQHQVNHFKAELDEKENITRQLDDLRRDAEHRLNISHKIENDLQHEVSQLKSVCQQHAEEVRRLEHGKGQAVEDARNIQKLNEELDHANSQLKQELRNLQGENSEIRSKVLDEVKETSKAELLKVQNELFSTKAQVVDIEKQITDLKLSHASEITEYQQSLSGLQTDLEDQKNKNNELRKKNWKVMDALKTAESKALNTTKQPATNIDEISKVRNEEQQANMQFILRLFPTIEVHNNLSHEEWFKNAEQHITNHLKSLEKPVVNQNTTEIERLQAQLKHYKAIVDDTEGILKKLQNHIEQEEILWRNEMQNKDLEMESIKKQYSSEFSTKVHHLELQLEVEKEAKQKLIEQYEQMKVSQSSAITANSAIIDKLSEEVKLLHHQLSSEKTKSTELSHHLTENNGSSKIENSSSNGQLVAQVEAK